MRAMGLGDCLCVLRTPRNDKSVGWLGVASHPAPMLGTDRLYPHANIVSSQLTRDLPTPVSAAQTNLEPAEPDQLGQRAHGAGVKPQRPGQRLIDQAHDPAE